MGVLLTRDGRRSITSLFAALCIHAIGIRRGTGVSRRIAEHRAQMSLLCLKEIQKYWRINNNVLDLFLQYLDRSIAERLHAAQADAAGGHDGADHGSSTTGLAPGAIKRPPDLADATDVDAAPVPAAAAAAATAAATATASPAMPPPRGGLQSPGPENAALFEDQYFNLVHGHWEGDDALGDLGLFLQADDLSPLKGLGVLGRSL